MLSWAAQRYTDAERVLDASGQEDKASWTCRERLPARPEYPTPVQDEATGGAFAVLDATVRKGLGRRTATSSSSSVHVCTSLCAQPRS